MSTQLSNLIDKGTDNPLLRPKGSDAYSQIRVINLPYNTADQLVKGKTNAFVSVNFPVTCINVITVVCNTASTVQQGTAQGYGLLKSNLVSNTALLGVAYLYTEYGLLLPGLKHYYTTPQMVNSNYEFWWEDSAGNPIVLDSTATFNTSVIIEFIGMNSGQVPVSSS